MTIQEAITVLLQHIEYQGKDTLPLREGLQDTPNRVAKSFAELYSGYSMDPKEILSRTFDHEPEIDHVRELVRVRDIPFYSMCEHHMLPFHGTVSIEYVPNNRVIGLSKFARLTDCFARRLQVQERLGREIGKTIFDVTGTTYVKVEISAVHMCMCSRGVQKHGAATDTCIEFRRDCPLDLSEVSSWAESKVSSLMWSDREHRECYLEYFMSGLHVWKHEGQLRFFKRHQMPLREHILAEMEEEGIIVRSENPSIDQVYYHMKSQ